MYVTMKQSTMTVRTQLSLLARRGYGINRTCFGLLGGHHQVYKTLAVGHY